MPHHGPGGRRHGFAVLLRGLGVGATMAALVDRRPASDTRRTLALVAGAALTIVGVLQRGTTGSVMAGIGLTTLARAVGRA